MNHISNDFFPLQLGEKKKVILKNGTSITTKWRKNNEYVIRYKPENFADYYSPYFLVKFENETLKKIIPYPNKRSFVLTIIVMIGFVYFKKVESDLYLTLFGISIIVTFLFQVVVGIACYNKIKTNVFCEK